MERGKAEMYAAMIVGMARSEKLTYKDFDRIIGFPTSEDRDQVYQELDKIKPKAFDSWMEKADELQVLINRNDPAIIKKVKARLLQETADLMLSGVSFREAQNMIRNSNLEESLYRCQEG